MATSAKPVKLEKRCCFGSLLWCSWLHKGKRVLPLAMERLLQLRRYLTESLNWHTAESCTKERESCIANKSPDKALSYFLLDKIHMAVWMPQECTTHSQVPETSTKRGGRRKKDNWTRRGDGKQPVLGTSRPLPPLCMPMRLLGMLAAEEGIHPQESKPAQKRSVLSLPATFTALCQLKSFNQNTATCTFEGKGTRQLITSTGGLATSIATVVVGAITASYQEGQRLLASVIKHRPLGMPRTLA